MLRSFHQSLLLIWESTLTVWYSILQSFIHSFIFFLSFIRLTHRPLQALYATESPRLGRRNSCAAAAAVGGASCVVVSFLTAAAESESESESSPLLPAMALLGLFGKLAVTVTFSSMYVLTGES